jgi:hypothetical protein
VASRGYRHGIRPTGRGSVVSIKLGHLLINFDFGVVPDCGRLADWKIGESGRIFGDGQEVQSTPST